MSVRLVVNPATTLMVTGALVRIRPLSSVATAVRLLGPAGTFAQAKLNGLLVSSPILVGPLKNSTLKMTPSRSVAWAERLIVDVATTTAPVAGLVRVTLGGMFDEIGG